MKGEYVKGKDPTNTIMFAKIHQTQNFQLQPYPTSAVHHPLELAAGEYQISEEADCPSRTTTTTTTKKDGASIELYRRPKGRPRGSRNKPKPPVIITRDTEPSMSPYILEIPAGSDVISSITLFCRRQNSGLCILNGSGAVSNVTLKQPSSTPGATVTFHGRFDVLSLSGTILQQPSQIGNNFTISLTGPQGQMVGGAVVGPLVAAGTMYVIAASFNSPAYHLLPVDDDVRSIEQANIITKNNEDGNEMPTPSGVSSGGESGRGPPSIYSCHLTSDVVWAPTARQPPPPAPY